jgi:hypothetical protein
VSHIPTTPQGRPRGRPPPAAVLGRLKTTVDDMLPSLTALFAGSSASGSACGWLPLACCRLGIVTSHIPGSDQPHGIRPEMEAQALTTGSRRGCRLPR